ncbi:MAG: 50S ribosomal protein L22 [Nitrospiraceae bacterium]|nr:50S ribosomal protein L22 [Nitrospiraceae bacterium]MDO9119572.1 50S ribosomal protein L22 [Nitrospira sp.]MDP3091706.1 50S ribosomal protein L22 [Nitrospira sp.]OQW63675.1 MAG: 50S ribosomal protein L22 [Nitrospira sp. ST-bin5]
MTEARAILRFVRVAPRKARPVIDMIRGQQVPQALAMLKLTPRQAARVVEKILRSAVANAEQKEMGDSESMVISKAFVNGGPTLKRFRARSQGRANSIHKRTSHITVVVAAPSVGESKKSA